MEETTLSEAPQPGSAFSLGNEFAPGERYSRNSWRKKSLVNSPNRPSGSNFHRVNFPSVCEDWPKGICPWVQLSFGSARTPLTQDRQHLCCSFWETRPTPRVTGSRALQKKVEFISIGGVFVFKKWRSPNLEMRYQWSGRRVEGFSVFSLQVLLISF